MLKPIPPSRRLQHCPLDNSISLQHTCHTSHNNNNLRLIRLRRAAQPYIRYITYYIQQSAIQGSNDTHTHTLSCRTAETTRFSPDGVGCQKQTAPSAANNTIMWAFTSYAFTRWRHLSTHQINRPTTHD